MAIWATVGGNLGSDAEIRDTKGGSVVSFRMASESLVKGEKTTTWVRVSLWGKRGEALLQHLVKGSKVAVVGELSLSEYKKDGETKTSVEIRCFDVTLMGKPASASGGGGGRPAASAPADDYDETGAADSDIPF